jgi:hypothetical protein
MVQFTLIRLIELVGGWGFNGERTGKYTYLVNSGDVCTYFY